MGAVGMRLRAEARSRWRAWLALALVLGTASGAAIAAVAGARRTESAYPRFAVAQEGFDAITGGGSERGFPERLAALKAHPLVEEHVEMFIVGGEITVPARRGRTETVVVFPDAMLTADPSGRYLYRVNRAKVLRGRLADPANPEEATVPFTIAERHGIELGDRLVAGIGFDFERFPQPRKRVPLRVVGITAAPGDFEALGQMSFTSIYVTPALYERDRDLLPLVPDTTSLGFLLRGGSGAATRFRQIVERDLSIDVPLIEPVTRSGVQKTIRLYVISLWLLGSLIAAAGAAILGQTLVRQQALESAEYPSLLAIGASRRQLIGLGALRAGLIGLAAASAAALTAWLLSPLAPIGPARTAEPHPGLAFDGIAIGLGAAIVAVFVPLVTLAPSLRAARTAATTSRGPAEGIRSSRLVEGVSRTARSPAVATGLRMALESGRGRTAVPVRTTILAVALGVAAVSASVVVGRSLTHLIDTPPLAGFTYDAILPDDEIPDNDAERIAALRAFPFVDRVAVGTALNVVFGERDSFLLALDRDGEIPYALIDGRAPADAPGAALPEIALGPTTMRRLGLRLEDTVEFGYPDPAQSEEEASGSPIERRLATQRARIVGVAAIPSVPWAVTYPGEGAVMTVQSVTRFDPLERGGCCFVAFSPGTDLAAARDRLTDAGFEVSLRTKRTDLTALARVGRMPALLSAIFAAMAAAALVHVLVTGIRRRRRDLAILKTLGFLTGQVRRAVAWQASATALIAVAIGIPAGVVLGRWGWRLVAGYFGVVPAPVTPTLVAVVVPAALVIANLAAALPGRVAARTRPALVLRTE